MKNDWGFLAVVLLAILFVLVTVAAMAYSNLPR